ncbi:MULTISPECIES: IucA/IucC family protein [unclassified Streptomyces]|uniref:IucA/IucC family protein n=1 Tax=unclassified Streptomyces TaxID=2593676 RepID=UPI0036E62905
MNSTSAPDGPVRTPTRGPSATETSRQPEPEPEPGPTTVAAPRPQERVPEQGRRDPQEAKTSSRGDGPGQEQVPGQAPGQDRAPAPENRQSVDRPRGTPADPLDHADPHTAAQAAAVENLLRCWVRESDLPAPADGTLRIPLPASGTALLAPVRYWSPTGWHRFGPPRLADVPPQAPPVDAVTVTALLTRERSGGSPDARALTAVSSPATDTEPAAVRAPVGQAAFPLLDATAGNDLAARVADSVRRTATFIDERRKHPSDESDLFLAAEQALVLGHPLHPAPKSREGLSEVEAPLYSPELRGSFPLHWIAVAPSVLATDSAWTERGRPIPAAQLTARLAETGLPLPDGHAALPLHPWQLREVRHHPATAALLDAGLLRDLGARGSAWHATSSVRTVYRSGAAAMLKLSLGLRITNSRRENLRKELHRGVEVHRLLRSGLVEHWQAVHPGFDIVRDPAWLAVDGPDGQPVPGLDVMIRHNPFRPTDDVSCVAGLVSPRPSPWPDSTTGGGTAGPPATRSRLADVVMRLAGRTGRPPGAVAAEWFLRYLEQVVRPVLWFDAEAGIALEAHQQNTLVHLDGDGWPVGGRYRDNQGYYFRASRRAELEARLPGTGEHSDTFVSDEVTDERFAYYLGINNVLGLIGAFGSQRLADERLLLAAFRRFLSEVASGPSRLRTSLPARLLDSPVLRCKANLLTRLHGLDELVGPVDTQSVYVTIANPLHS